MIKDTSPPFRDGSPPNKSIRERIASSTFPTLSISHVVSDVDSDPFSIFATKVMSPMSTRSSNHTYSVDASPSQDAQSDIIGELERTLQGAGYQGLLASRGLDALRTATLCPPITYETLHELDVDVLTRDFLLRHDMNFVSNIYFDHNLSRFYRARKEMEAEQYWDAVEIEVSLYATYNTASAGIRRGSQRDQGSRPVISKELFERIPKRVPQLIIDLRALMVSIIPPRRDLIESLLDADLITQQISQSAYDITGLVQSLEMLLAEGDTGKVKKCRERGGVAGGDLTTTGETTHDTPSLVGKIRSLFKSIERIKISIATEYLDTNRELLLAGFTTFEQKHVSALLKDEPGIQNWLPRNDTKEKVSVFLSAFAGLIYSHEYNLPFPLLIDSPRIREMQAGFESDVFVQACIQVLQSLNQNAHLPRKITERSAHRLCKTIRCLLSDRSMEEWSKREASALEIVREASNPTTMTRNYIPDSHAVERATADLNHLLDRSQEAGRKHHQLVVNYYDAEFKHDVDVLKKLDTVQMSQRHAFPPAPSYRDGDTHPRSREHQDLQFYGLLNGRSVHASLPSGAEMRSHITTMGDRITFKMAHVALLHWRVWGPLLYLKDDVGKD